MPTNEIFYCGSPVRFYLLVAHIYLS